MSRSRLRLGYVWILDLLREKNEWEIMLFPDSAVSTKKRYMNLEVLAIGVHKTHKYMDLEVSSTLSLPTILQCTCIRIWSGKERGRERCYHLKSPIEERA